MIYYEDDDGDAQYEKLIQGEIYIVKKDFIAQKLSDVIQMMDSLKPDSKVYPLNLRPALSKKPFVLKRNDIFVFLEEVQLELNTFSKILVDEHILLTYNSFLLTGCFRKMSMEMLASDKFSNKQGHEEDEPV